MVVSLALLIGMSSDVQAGDPPRTYFKFVIPTNADGTRVHYSLGWFGVMDYVPKNVTVLLYNDKDGYGYAYTTDTYMAKEAIVKTQKEVDDTIKLAKEEKGVYFGQKIYDRWLPEIEVREVRCTVDEKGFTVINKSEEVYGEILSKKAVYCPICDSFVFWYFDGLLDNSVVVYCPNGHRLLTIGYDSIEVAKDIKE
jgi:hypothetical protein